MEVGESVKRIENIRKIRGVLQKNCSEEKEKEGCKKKGPYSNHEKKIVGFLSKTNCGYPVRLGG